MKKRTNCRKLARRDISFASPLAAAAWIICVLGASSSSPSAMPTLAPEAAGQPQFVYISAGDLFIVNISDVTTVEQLTSDGRNSQPLWSPDGNRLAFIKQSGNTQSLYVMDVTTRKSEELPQSSTDGIIAFGWSHDSTQVAYSNNVQMLVWDQARKVLEQVDIPSSSGRTIILPGSSVSPSPFVSWSPDNKMFAFVVTEPGKESEVWLREQTRDPIRVSFGHDPAWRPQMPQPAVGTSTLRFIVLALAVTEGLIITGLVIVLIKKRPEPIPQPVSELPRFISELIGMTGSRDYLGEMVKTLYLAQARPGQPSREYLIRLLEGFLHHIESTFRLKPVVPPHPTSAGKLLTRYDPKLHDHDPIGEPRTGEEVNVLEFGWQIVLPDEHKPIVVKKALVSREEHNR